ncbi:pantetheine-phosphate adenylyltransferase [Fundicoccus culcitae]|uniref:Phosphopantetheine adenylyltransferase n=1 Tax=Fundicoccus culcitae TaxID=2969821 RepID=A0ABY5P6X1_9LACT|nr:pantetheine-phosphate adenylyltransferase [Fundicoccus culcitae]UUX34289.1 pantetheine-phosphate adenylyltransferase [Fundicoccus culcitae]
MNNKTRIGIFAGSFDPLTNGHFDLIKRSSKIFDQVIVLIAVNTSKTALFTALERFALIEAVIKDIANVKVDVLEDDLVANYFKKVNGTAMIRGLRNSQDYEYESNIDIINKKQNDELDTVLLYADNQYRYLSSSLIKEIATFHGDISEMVPEEVEQAMKVKYNYPK